MCVLFAGMPEVAVSTATKLFVDINDIDGDVQLVQQPILAEEASPPSSSTSALDPNEWRLFELEQRQPLTRNTSKFRCVHVYCTVSFGRY